MPQDKLLADPMVMFEAWWNAKMGDRMRHSKYLAKAAWRAAFKRGRSKIQNRLRVAIDTLGRAGFREWLQLYVDELGKEAERKSAAGRTG